MVAEDLRRAEVLESLREGEVGRSEVWLSRDEDAGTLIEVVRRQLAEVGLEVKPKVFGVPGDQTVVFWVEVVGEEELC